MKRLLLVLSILFFTNTLFAQIAPISGTTSACVGASSGLSDATAGGAWSSSNPSIAIVSSSGVVTGISAGTVNIIYTVATSFVSVSFTVNPLPASITGTNHVCVNDTVTLHDASPGGTWSSSNTSIATIGATTGFVTGVTAGMVTMSYTLPTGCYRTYAFTVNPNPGAITGPGKVLSGSTITLSDITPGGNWTSNNPALASIGISTGIVTPISSGSGVTMISYTIPSTGCLTTRKISINPLPDSDLVTWYPFCNDITDHTGTGHDLIPTPTYAFPTSAPIDTLDRFGLSHNAFWFNGADAILQYSTTLSYTSTSGDFTYSFWFKPYSNQNSLILYNGNPASDGFGFMMDDGNGTGTPGGYLSVLFGGVNQFLPTPITLGAWHNVVLVKNGNSYRLYIDNVSIGFFIATFNTPSLGSYFVIGMDYVGGGRNYLGYIDDIAINNKQLTTLERVALFNFNPDARPFSLGADTAICSDSILLAPNPQTITSTYYWSTGDTIDTAIRVYPSPSIVGSTYILLITQPFGCSARDTITVYKRPIPVRLGNDTNLCIGDTITLHATMSGVTYTWNTGSTDSTIRVSETGIYAVQVDSGVCVGRDTIRVHASQIPIVDLGPDIANCQGQQDTLRPRVDPGYTYLWNDYSTGDSLIITTSGTYFVTVNDTGCVRSDTMFAIIVYDTFTFAAHDTAVCKGGYYVPQVTYNPIITYQWTPSTGMALSNIPQPVIRPDTSATYYLRTMVPGCPDVIDSFFFDVQPNPTLYLGGNRNVCSMDSIHMTAIASPQWYTHYQYRWSPGIAFDDSTVATVVFFAGDSTHVVVKVSTPAGCFAMDSIEIFVHPSVFDSLTLLDTAVCPGDSVHFAIVDTIFGSTAAYHWSPGYYFDDSTSATPWLHPITTEDYHVIGTNEFGCQDTFRVHVVVNPAATIFLGDSGIIHPGESYQIPTQSNASYYHWTPYLGLNDTAIKNPVASPLVSTRYIVTARTEDGCVITDSIRIHVNPETEVYLPNAFAPGSGPNNMFLVLKKGIAKLNYLRIYNRWGLKVFESTDIDKGWDGTYNGQPQPFGVYVYELEAESDRGKIFQRQGNITLIR